MTHSAGLMAAPPRFPSDQDASGRTLGDEEICLLAQAIRSGTLTSTKGQFVKRLERSFAELHGMPHALACSSGSAALHAAVAAVDPEPGDEIVTTAITDMGALAPILYQGAIPVFADVDPATCNLTAASIRRCLGPRTRAIVVTHLFGNPCPMDEIADLAREFGLLLIEDCAQAYLARAQSRLVGTIGDIGCFSLQQGKHVTTGEGGLVVARDEALARRMFLFVNKAWGYGDPQPDHYFLALNYRLSELQGAVAVAQFDKLRDAVERRIALAERLTSALDGPAGIAAPSVRAGDVHSFWRYCLRVDADEIPGGAVALGGILSRLGITCSPRYIQKPAFDCAVFREQRTFGQSRWPFTLARKEAVDYDRGRFPGTYAALEGALVLGWNERYSEEQVDYIAATIHDSVHQLRNSA